MNYIKDTYTYVDYKGVSTTFSYEVVLKNGKVKRVFNNKQSSITENSEVFNFFKDKYNK